MWKIVFGMVCRVKIVYGEDIYKVTVKEYQELLDYIYSNIFKDNARVTNFKLNYVDSESDVIVLKC